MKPKNKPLLPKTGGSEIKGEGLNDRSVANQTGNVKESDALYARPITATGAIPKNFESREFDFEEDDTRPDERLD